MTGVERGKPEEKNYDEVGRGKWRRGEVARSRLRLEGPGRARGWLDDDAGGGGGGTSDVDTRRGWLDADAQLLLLDPGGGGRSSGVDTGRSGGHQQGGAGAGLVVER